MSKLIKLVISIVIPLIVGMLGSLFTSMSVKTWYQTIKKPVFNPPNWLFAPVWTILFILIGLSFYFVWINNFGKYKNLCLFIYSLQLFFNLFWSASFFGLKSPLLASIVISILWILIVINIVLFYKVIPISGFLLIPYILWVSFAAILNFSIVTLN